MRILGLLLGTAAATRLRNHAALNVGNPSATEALQRLAAVEDMRRSRVLCRVGSKGDSVTVRLHSDNSRSLAFNDDTSGFETRIKCVGQADTTCATQSANVDVDSVDQCPECPCHGTEGHLFGPYSRVMAAEVDGRCHRAGDMATRVLLLGFGGGELAEHLAQRCRDRLTLDAVELDSRLPQLAVKYFGLPSSVRVTVGDALPVARGLKADMEADQLTADSRRYDVILVDCFSTGGVTPEHCRNHEFVKTLHGLLQPGGRVMHHLWRRDPKHEEVAPEHDATVALYRQEYSCPGCATELHPVSMESVDDLIVASIPAVSE